DVLKVVRQGVSIRYYRNQDLLYTDSGPSTGAMVLDTSIWSTSGKIENAYISGQLGDRGLCVPTFLALDAQENLYLSDHILEQGGNGRMLRFAPIPSLTAPVFGPAAAYVFPHTAGFEAAFDSRNRMF